MLECPIYMKHHNTVDGIFLTRKPTSFEEIPDIDPYDKEDEDNELYALFQDIKIYDIEDLSGFTNPVDKHNIKESIFVIRKNGKYFLCETQGADYVKFSINISDVDFVKIYDRLEKIKKIKENINSY
jgi:uncharacterized protein YpuA (DUF1002 family)